MKLSRQYFKYIKHLMKEGKYESALILLDINFDTLFPYTAKFLRAECKMQLRQYDDAFRLFKELVPIYYNVAQYMLKEVLPKTAHCAFKLEKWNDCIKYSGLSAKLLAKYNTNSDKDTDDGNMFKGREALCLLIKAIAHHKLGQENQTQDTIQSLLNKYYVKYFPCQGEFQAFLYEAVLVRIDSLINLGDKELASDYLLRAHICDAICNKSTHPLFDLTLNDVYDRYSQLDKADLAGGEGLDQAG